MYNPCSSNIIDLRVRVSSNRKIFYRCASLVRTGIEILTSAGQLIDWKATIHFDTTPWEAVNLRATRASANRVDAGVSLLNKKQRDIFTEPEPWQKLKRRKEGEICCKKVGWNGEIIRKQRTTMFVCYNESISVFSIVSFSLRGRWISEIWTQDIDSIDRRKWNIVFRLQERCG